MTQGEQKFINEYARTLLVDWAFLTIRNGNCHVESIREELRPYLDHALDKGWVSKRTPFKVTAKGFSVAASFLKR